MEQNTNTQSDSPPTTKDIVKEVENPTMLKGISLKNVFSIAGIIGLTIAGAFVIRGYLDLLRIKKIKSGGKIEMED